MLAGGGSGQGHFPNFRILPGNNQVTRVVLSANGTCVGAVTIRGVVVSRSRYRITFTKISIAIPPQRGAGHYLFLLVHRNIWWVSLSAGVVFCLGLQAWARMRVYCYSRPWLSFPLLDPHVWAIQPNELTSLHIKLDRSATCAAIHT